MNGRAEIEARFLKAAAAFLPACKKAAAAFEKCGFISARQPIKKYPRGHKNGTVFSTKKPRSAPGFIVRVQQSRSGFQKNGPLYQHGRCVGAAACCEGRCGFVAHSHPLAKSGGRIDAARVKKTGPRRCPTTMGPSASRIAVRAMSTALPDRRGHFRPLATTPATAPRHPSQGRGTALPGCNGRSAAWLAVVCGAPCLQCGTVAPLQEQASGAMPR